MPHSGAQVFVLRKCILDAEKEGTFALAGKAPLINNKRLKEGNTKMPKRSCPFPQNCNQMKMHIDMRHVGKEAYQQEVYGKFCGEASKQQNGRKI